MLSTNVNQIPLPPPAWNGGTVTNRTLFQRAAGTTIAASAHADSTLEVSVPDSRSARMVFFRPGFAANFGIDNDNILKIGGISMGNVAHNILHSGNSETLISSILINTHIGTTSLIGRASLLRVQGAISNIVRITVRGINTQQVTIAGYNTNVVLPVGYRPSGNASAVSAGQHGFELMIQSNGIAWVSNTSGGPLTMSFRHFFLEYLTDM